MSKLSKISVEARAFKFDILMKKDGRIVGLMNKIVSYTLLYFIHFSLFSYLACEN